MSDAFFYIQYYCTARLPSQEADLELGHNTLATRSGHGAYSIIPSSKAGDADKGDPHFEDTSESSCVPVMPVGSAATYNDDEDGVRLTVSPSNLLFMLTYEDLQDEAEEAVYAKRSTAQKVVHGLAFAVLAVVGLYFFMVAINLIGDSVTLLLSCSTKNAFDFTDNPLAGLLIGTVTTALVHSSSTVTSITVALVAADAMTIRQGVFVVMGANIGTCITCIMVAFGHVKSRARFQRAMAGALIHDMYNVASVVVMFPLEVFFRPLEKLSVALAGTHTNHGTFKSPVDAIVNPLSSQLLSINSTRLGYLADGTLDCEKDGMSVISSGVFLELGLGKSAIGGIVLAIGLVMLFTALMTFVHTLAKVFLGRTKRVISAVLEYNGYVNIVVGLAITFVVHSSTVVTSMLTPMAGLGVLTLEQVYPIAIGANLGTTGNAMLTAFVTGKRSGVAIALTHFFFNVFGIFLFYPIPIMRTPILSWARSLAHYSASWPMAAVLFLLVTFIIIPAIGLGLVYMITSSDGAVVAVGYVLLVLAVVHLTLFTLWYYQFGGRSTWYSLLERKRVEHEVRKYGGNLGLPSFVDEYPDAELDEVRI